MIPEEDHMEALAAAYARIHALEAQHGTLAEGTTTAAANGEAGLGEEPALEYFEKEGMQNRQRVQDSASQRPEGGPARRESDACQRVTIWNHVEGRKLSGNSAPFRRNLEEYFRTHPGWEEYVGQEKTVPPPPGVVFSGEGEKERNGAVGESEEEPPMVGAAGEEEELLEQAGLGLSGGEPENEASLTKLATRALAFPRLVLHRRLLLLFESEGWQPATVVQTIAGVDQKLRVRWESDGQEWHIRLREWLFVLCDREGNLNSEVIRGKRAAVPEAGVPALPDAGVVWDHKALPVIKAEEVSDPQGEEQKEEHHAKKERKEIPVRHPARPREPSANCKCECGRLFASPQALGGHKHGCEKAVAKNPSKNTVVRAAAKRKLVDEKEAQEQTKEQNGEEKEAQEQTKEQNGEEKEAEGKEENTKNDDDHEEEEDEEEDEEEACWLDEDGQPVAREEPPESEEVSPLAAAPPRPPPARKVAKQSPSGKTVFREDPKWLRDLASSLAPRPVKTEHEARPVPLTGGALAAARAANARPSDSEEASPEPPPPAAPEMAEASQGENTDAEADEWANQFGGVAKGGEEKVEEEVEVEGAVGKGAASTASIDERSVVEDDNFYQQREEMKLARVTQEQCRKEVTAHMQRIQANRAESELEGGAEYT